MQGTADGCTLSEGGNPGLGQNMCQGSLSWAACVHGWEEELELYSFNNPGFSPATGHFTQVQL